MHLYWKLLDPWLFSFERLRAEKESHISEYVHVYFEKQVGSSFLR